MSQAHTLGAFAVLMALSGAFNPLYRVGADAMMADLIPIEKRVDAYSLMRMSNNIGVALGPTVGGFVATASYTVTFCLAAGGMLAYSMLLATSAAETLPSVMPAPVASAGSPSRPERLRGYGRVISDRSFTLFTIASTLTQVCSAMIWVLLAVYAKEHYAVPENLYGFIPITNALMVVSLQVWVTRGTKQFPPLGVLAAGALIYAIAVSSVAWGTGFWSFWLSMVVLTMGELMIVPTATTYVANLAPATMRGRYMSIYGLTWSVAAGIGPLWGGLLADHVGPRATWYGAGFAGLLSVVLLVVLARGAVSSRRTAPQEGRGAEVR
jgi:MFS family permease